MRFSFLIIMILSGTIMHAQDITHIGCRRVVGYIIPKEVQLLPESNRFTPSVDDIIKAETILRQSKLKDKSHQLTIKMAGNNYIRQYVGYISDSNNKVILMIFTKKGIIKDEKRFMSFITFLDGGKNHWQVKVDIDNNQIKDIEINGPG